PRRPPPRPTLFPYTTLFRSKPCTADKRSGTPCRRQNLLTCRTSSRLPTVLPLPRSNPTPRIKTISAAAGRRGLHSPDSAARPVLDRKSTRLNSSHLVIPYAV